MYIIVVNTHTTDRDTIMKVMKEQTRKNKFDELEKEINALKERVAKIEDSFNVKDKEDNEAKALFM